MEINGNIGGEILKNNAVKQDKKFIAHIREDGQIQTVKEHLKGTAKISQDFAEKFDMREFAKAIGLLHDIGKYSGEFQERINGKNIRVDHSTAGAKEIDKLNKDFGKLFSYCIAGHHSGLQNGGSSSDIGNEGTLSARLNNKNIKDYSYYLNEISIEDEMVRKTPKIIPINKGGFSLSFLVRMLYSCLVDADFLDTESFMSNNSIKRGNEYNLEQFSKSLFDYLKKFENDKRKINIKRTEILNQCIEKAFLDRGLFTLEVPTGGGKTLSSLAFAIKHAIKNEMDRIIYVIPYTSIIEQNAKIFKDILGEENVFEHHSNFDFKNADENEILKKQKLSSENWNIPIIVTTNVQFFESLFANKSSRCRKLHNIANSIIVFDEAQMLPTEYLTPCIMAISELVQNYKVSAVLCSATQPALEKLFPNTIKPIDICENKSDLYDFFKRTKIINRETINDEELKAEIDNKNQVLCIVNTRKHALKLFSVIKQESAFHLSTLMCPAHRKQVIHEIKTHLKNNMPCKVISTQLIEAGVDVDFPFVYRSMAGLDSIIQSAGRCNREKKSDFGEVYLFESESEYKKHQPSVLKRPIELTKTIMNRFDDILSPIAIKTYFEELYYSEGKNGLDIKGIYDDLEEGISNGLNFNFEDIDKEFKLIENVTRPIVIPFDDNAKKLIENLKYVENTGGILRSLQVYTVNIYEQEFEMLFSANKIDLIKDEIAILRSLENDYDKMMGLKLVEKMGIGIFISN